LKIKTANFLLSNSDYKKCPTGDTPEFSFIGRSNVGKSSLINSLVSRKSLAKTSGRPGKTQLINHFEINDTWYLVDLPGYGWARVSKSSRKTFQEIITGYLLNREGLISTFVLIDIRLEPQKIDLEFISWMGENGLPFIIVFTKCDKIGKTKVQQAKARYSKVLLESWDELPQMITSSSTTGMGRDELLDYIETHLPK
jgi:GTP-binding protein